MVSLSGVSIPPSLRRLIPYKSQSVSDHVSELKSTDDTVSNLNSSAHQITDVSGFRPMKYLVLEQDNSRISLGETQMHFYDWEARLKIRLSFDLKSFHGYTPMEDESFG